MAEAPLKGPETNRITTAENMKNPATIFTVQCPKQDKSWKKKSQTNRLERRRAVLLSRLEAQQHGPSTVIIRILLLRRRTYSFQRSGEGQQVQMQPNPTRLRFGRNTPEIEKRNESLDSISITCAQREWPQSFIPGRGNKVGSGWSER